MLCPNPKTKGWGIAIEVAGSRVRLRVRQALAGLTLSLFFFLQKNRASTLFITSKVIIQGRGLNFKTLEIIYNE